MNENQSREAAKERNWSNPLWAERICLEYVLTWNYTYDYEKDEKRYIELGKHFNNE